jgi:hypothetical protein
MTPNETTRIEFAERQGYIKREVSDTIQDPETRLKWTYWRHPTQSYDVPFRELPKPTDYNHVFAALMGMNKNEWRSFSEKLYSKMVASITIMSIEQILKTPPLALVSYYLEATKNRTHETSRY